MLLEVITPDELLFKGSVTHVQLPGLDGSFGVLNNHASTNFCSIRRNCKG